MLGVGTHTALTRHCYLIPMHGIPTLFLLDETLEAGGKSYYSQECLIQITLRDFMGYKRQEESGESAFDFVDCSNRFGGECNDDFPKVDWVRGPTPAKPPYLHTRNLGLTGRWSVKTTLSPINLNGSVCLKRSRVLQHTKGVFITFNLRI